MSQPLLLLGTQLCSVPLLPPPKRFRVELQKSLRPLERRNHASGLRLPVRPALSPWQKREPCRRACERKEWGHHIPRNPGFGWEPAAECQTRRNTFQGGREPCRRAKGPSKQGPRWAPGAAHLEISHAGGRSRVSLVTASEPRSLPQPGWTQHT